MDVKYDRSRHFEIPKYFYFEAMNSTVGGRSTYNYRIDPIKRENENGETELILRIRTWVGLMCSDLAEFEGDEEFPHTFDGYKDMIFWLDKDFDVYMERIASGELQNRRTFKGDLY